MRVLVLRFFVLSPEEFPQNVSSAIPEQKTNKQTNKQNK